MRTAVTAVSPRPGPRLVSSPTFLAATQRLHWTGVWHQQLLRQTFACSVTTECGTTKISHNHDPRLSPRHSSYNSKLETCKTGGWRGIKTMGGIQYLCSNKTQINSQIYSKYPSHRATFFDLIEPGLSEFVWNICSHWLSGVSHYSWICNTTPHYRSSLSPGHALLAYSMETFIIASEIFFSSMKYVA